MQDMLEITYIQNIELYIVSQINYQEHENESQNISQDKNHRD